jgi:hypothetical protein
MNCEKLVEHFVLTQHHELATQKLNNEITPWSRDLLEKLTVTLLVKKVLAFYRTRSFIIMFTRAHHWSVS